jgi:putative DNA primase/helicase
MTPEQQKLQAEIDAVKLAIAKLNAPAQPEPEWGDGPKDEDIDLTTVMPEDLGLSEWDCSNPLVKSMFNVQSRDSNIPQDLKTLPNWVRWQLEEVDGRLTKVPYQKNGAKASSTNPTTWTGYDNIKGIVGNETKGIGIVTDGTFIGFDLDGCRNPQTGEITQWAQRLIDVLGCYTEITPSGYGVRVYTLGKLPEGSRRFSLALSAGFGDKVGIECYDTGRYFTVTGNIVGSVTSLQSPNIVQAHQLCADLSREYPSDKRKAAAGSNATDTNSSVQFTLKPGGLTSKLAVLMYGDITSRSPFVVENEYGRVESPSQSEADFSLVTMLAMKYGNNPDQIDSDFRESVLYREKWERLGEQTIAKAIKSAERAERNTRFLPTTKTIITEPQEDGMPIPPDTINLTETGNARLVLVSQGQNIRYVPYNDEFLFYDKTRGVWAPDNNDYQVERMMKDVTKSVLRETKQRINELKEQAEHLMEVEDRTLTPEQTEVVSRYTETVATYKWALKSEANRTIKGSIALIKSEEGMAVEPEDMNKNRMMVNVLNGALLFSMNGEVVFRNHLRTDYCDRVMPVEFNPTAECPTFLAFINQMMQGRQDYVDFLQEFFGFCLTGQTLRLILILYGAGLDGKGALTRTIGKVLGEGRQGYFANVGMKTFMHIPDLSKDSPRPDILALQEPYLVVAQEAQRGKQCWDMEMIKKLTGGDALVARKMHSDDMRQFYPKCKIVVCLNHLPQINDDSKAASDRIALVQCNLALDKDKVDLTLEPRMAEEASGILNWMIEGLGRALKRRAERGAVIQIPEGVELDSHKYHESENPIAQFAADSLEQAEGASVGSTEVFEAYTKWARSRGVDPGTQKAFVQYLTKRLGYDQSRNESERGFKGVRLVSQGLVVDLQKG